MKLNWKAIPTISLTILSWGLSFQQSALSYDALQFPGKSSKTSFLQACEICQQGIRLQKAGRNQKSIELFKQAVRTYPDGASFHYNLGLAYANQNDLKNALPCFKSATKLAPDFVEAYNNISEIHFQQRDFKAAEHTAGIASNLDSSSALAWINLAQAEIAQAKAGSARQHLQIAKNLPGAEGYSNYLKQLNSKLQRLSPAKVEN